MRAEQAERGAVSPQQIEQCRNGQVDLRGRQRRVPGVNAHVPHTRQRRQLAGIDRRFVRNGEFDDVLGAERLDQLARRAERDQPAAIHDADAIAERMRFVHVVRRDQDRAAARPKAAEHLP